MSVEDCEKCIRTVRSEPRVPTLWVSTDHIVTIQLLSKSLVMLPFDIASISNSQISSMIDFVISKRDAIKYDYFLNYVTYYVN